MFWNKDKTDYKSKCEYLEVRIASYEGFFAKCRKYDYVQFTKSGGAVGYSKAEILQDSRYAGVGFIVPEECVRMIF